MTPRLGSYGAGVTRETVPSTRRRASPRHRGSLVGAGVLGVGLFLTGCSGGGYGTAGGPTTSASVPSTASPTGSAPASSTASPSSSTSTPTDHPRRCTLAQLDVGATVPSGAGAAGSTALLLTFRDTADVACVLDGFPGVSFVGGGDGTQLGVSARRTGAAQTVTLEPGRTTTALVRVADAGSYPETSCDPTAADGLRVYPPGSTEAAFVRYPTKACRGSTGDSPQLTVASVGTTA